MLVALRRTAAATVFGTWVAACAGATPETPASGAAGATSPAETPPEPGVAAGAAATPQGQNPVSGSGFDATRAWDQLTAQVAFGPRPSGSAALNATRQYLLTQLGSAGIATRQQTFIARTPLGEVSMSNIIATIPGRRQERITLASHFDTKIARDFRFVGANDGASSTAALLEIGRVLAARQNEFTIELLFLDGEEAVNWNWQGSDNTYGSRHYVDAGTKDGTLSGIKALMLLDMIGDRDLVIRRDSNSTPWLVDLVWAAAASAGHRGTFIDELTTIEDDHLPFLGAGVPAVDIIDLDNPTWHTPQDDLAHVSARSLQIVGDVVLAAIPALEERLASPH